MNTSRAFAQMELQLKVLEEEVARQRAESLRIAEMVKALGIKRGNALIRQFKILVDEFFEVPNVSFLLSFKKMTF